MPPFVSSHGPLHYVADVRWRIERHDDKPFGIAGLWESRTTKDGDPAWSFTMLTINADEHPLMHRFHKLGDEKRWDELPQAGCVS